MTATIGWGVCLGAIALMVIVLIRMARRPLLLRLLAASAVASGAIALQCVIASICTAPRFDSADLAQVVAMSRGYRLYPRPAEGVMSSWTDGPIAALAFLPASLVSSPTTQILIAAGTATFLIFASAIWLHLRLAGRKHRGFALLALLSLIWCILGDTGMARMTFFESAAGPMVALMIATIALLTYRPSTWTLASAALCSALVCWCKTDAAAWFIVPAAYLALVDGWRTAGKFLLLLLLALALVSIGVLMRFNPRAMWYYMITLPLAQPWYESSGQGRFSALATALIEMIRSAIPALALLAAAIAISRFLAPRGRDESRLNPWWRSPWIMLPLSAAVLLPGSAFEYLKIEHDAASMAPVNLLLAMTTSTALILSYRSLASDQAERSGSTASTIFAPAGDAPDGCELAALCGAARPIFVAGLCIFSVCQVAPIALAPDAVSDIERTIAQTYMNRHEIAYAYLQTHVGQGYFPGDTLATLLVSGKLYHSEEGIRLRYFALPPQNRFNLDQIKSHLPAHAHFVAFSTSAQSREAINFFPKARNRISVPELPGFVLYTEQP